MCMHKHMCSYPFLFNNQLAATIGNQIGMQASLILLNYNLENAVDSYIVTALLLLCVYWRTFVLYFQLSFKHTWLNHMHCFWATCALIMVYWAGTKWWNSLIDQLLLSIWTATVIFNNCTRELCFLVTYDEDMSEDRPENLFQQMIPQVYLDLKDSVHEMMEQMKVQQKLPVMKSEQFRWVPTASGIPTNLGCSSFNPNL